MDSDLKRLRMKEIDAMAAQIANYMGNELRRIVPCCPNCLNWNNENETCTLASARPPARVIAFGCTRFDDLPF